MEKQTRHRILGIIVVIALVIIALPFFQSNKELTSEAALVAAPAFPDESAEVIPTSATIPPQASISTPASIPAPAAILSAPTPAAIPSAQQTKATPIFAKADIQLSKQEIIPPKIPLNNANWVVQIGSFKNKANALHIVNHLRANGYRAFIQEITTAYEKTTRVYVGPERKQTTAHALASKLQAEMHLKGVVLSYTPLTL